MLQNTRMLDGLVETINGKEISGESTGRWVGHLSGVELGIHLGEEGQEQQTGIKVGKVIFNVSFVSTHYPEKFTACPPATGKHKNSRPLATNMGR